MGPWTLRITATDTEFIKGPKCLEPSAERVYAREVSVPWIPAPTSCDFGDGMACTLFDIRWNVGANRFEAKIGGNPMFTPQDVSDTSMRRAAQGFVLEEIRPVPAEGKT